MMMTFQLKMLAILPMLGAMGLVAACQTPPETAAAKTPMAELQEMTITGSAAYRERIALAPGAVFEAYLSDVSLADAPAPVLARYAKTLDGEQVPLPFTLTVKEHEIKTNMRYAVRATITGTDGALQWTTDTVHFIDPEQKAQDLGVLQMVRVGSSPAADASSAGAALEGVSYQVEDINGGGVIDNSHVTLAFDGAGRVTGSTGCNSFAGPYTLTGSALTVGPLATTRRGCVPAIMEQESRFLDVLGAITSWSKDEVGRVTLKTDDGRTLRAIGAEPQ